MSNYNNALLIDQANQITALEEKITALERFKQEWTDRFGFLATINPPDSFASINEVANLINERK